MQSITQDIIIDTNSVFELSVQFPNELNIDLTQYHGEFELYKASELQNSVLTIRKKSDSGIVSIDAANKELRLEIYSDATAALPTLNKDDSLYIDEFHYRYQLSLIKVEATQQDESIQYSSTATRKLMRGRASIRD